MAAQTIALTMKSLLVAGKKPMCYDRLFFTGQASLVSARREKEKRKLVTENTNDELKRKADKKDDPPLKRAALGILPVYGFYVNLKVPFSISRHTFF